MRNISPGLSNALNIQKWPPNAKKWKEKLHTKMGFHIFHIVFHMQSTSCSKHAFFVQAPRNRAQRTSLRRKMRERFLNFHTVFHMEAH